MGEIFYDDRKTTDVVCDASHSDDETRQVAHIAHKCTYRPVFYIINT